MFLSKISKKVKLLNMIKQLEKHIMQNERSEEEQSKRDRFSSIRKTL